MALSVQIGNPLVAYPVLEGTAQTDDTADNRCTATFTVFDPTGVLSFQPGTPVVLTDSDEGYTFTGNINDTATTPFPPGVAMAIVVNCIDGHYYADKRYYRGPEWQNRYAGDIAIDLVDKVLAAEGVNSSYAASNAQSVQDWQAGLLNGTVATDNIPGGDLELAPAGPMVEIVEQGSTFATGTIVNTTVNAAGDLAQAGFYAIKLDAKQNLNNGGNTYTYVKIIDGGGFTIASNTYFTYELFVLPTSPAIQIALDIVFTDGTTMRDFAPSYAYDEQAMAPHPKTDLSGLANVGNWYRRAFGLSFFVGKVVQYISIACEGDKVGEYVGYVRNLYWAIDANGDSPTPIFPLTQSSLSDVQQLQNYGYSLSSVSVVRAYNPYDYRLSPAYSLDNLKICASTYLSWVETSTDTTKAGQEAPLTFAKYKGPPNGSYVEIAYTLDGGQSFINCDNNAPLPDFPAGMSTSGLSIQFFQFLISGISPEDSPTLNLFQCSFFAGISGTKTDIQQEFVTNTQWNSGTYSNVTANGGQTISLKGATRNWDDANSANQPLYGGSGAEIFTSNKTLCLGADLSYDARCRMDFAGTWSTTFTMECDVQVSANYYISLIWCDTNWGNSNDSYAYCAQLTSYNFKFGYGNNSTGSGSYTSLASDIGLTLTAGDWHRLKVVKNGTQHTVYLDNVQMFQVTDSTYASGYVGLRVFAASGGHQRGFFDNFGIMPALTGTWISPSINLAPAVSYVNSDLYFANVSEDTTSCTVVCDVSTNAGSTWTTVQDFLPLQGLTGTPIFTSGQSLSGVSLLIRITLTTTTASSMPAVNTLLFKLIGVFSASGSRVSLPLDLSPVGRVGNTLASFTAIQPPNTAVYLDTSLDGVNWTQVAAGTPVTPGSTVVEGAGQIAGILTQTDTEVDTFSVDSSRYYTSINGVGGSLSTWVWDTTHNRIVASGGQYGILLFNGASIGADIDVSVVLDSSTGGGLVWRYTDPNNLYYIVIGDDASGTPNTLKLCKVVGGTRTVLTSAAITFPHGTPHFFRVIMEGAAITVSMDGSTVIAQNDSSLTASGFCGLRNDSGTANFYVFRVLFFGQDATGYKVYTRLRLTSADATISAQVTDLSVSVRNTNIEAGALITQTAYSILNGNKQLVSAILDDLVKQSGSVVKNTGSYLWKIKAGQLYFQHSQATPAPWVVTGSDTLVSGIEVDGVNWVYRNSQWITDATDLIPQVEDFIGDGQTTTFTTRFPIDSVTSITLNGLTQTIGIKGVDTGKNWYYTQGQNSVIADAAAIPLNDTQALSVAYNAQITIAVNVRNPQEIARIADLDATTGIVEEAEDGKGLTKQAAISKGAGFVGTYAVETQTLKYSTLRGGLMPGQMQAAFIGPMNIFAGLFLITEVKRTWQTTIQNGVMVRQAWHDVIATDGPVTGDWCRFVANLAN